MKLLTNSASFKRTSRYFMSSYLVFYLVFYNGFNIFMLRGDMSFYYLLQCWYLALLRHKSSFHFYRIQDSFVGRFRNMMTWKESDELTMKTKTSSHGRENNIMIIITLRLGYMVLK